MMWWQVCYLATILAGCFPKVSSFASLPTDRKFLLGGTTAQAQSLVLLPATIETSTPEVTTDNRPHDHRAKEARKARRLNHSFRYLYREKTGVADDNANKEESLTARDYLKSYGGYTDQQIDDLNQTFPPLLELDVQRHLIPKMRFLKETILEMKDGTQVLPAQVRTSLPPHYYGSRLERIIAPRHAFLVHMNLPHGKDLLLGSIHDETIQGTTNSSSSATTRWQDFLTSCRNTKQFAALCNRWAREAEEVKRNNPKQPHSFQPSSNISPKQIEAFDFLFGRGLMAAARDEVCQSNNTWPLDHINITSGEMIGLLVKHGANPLERDNRGVSLLHWAAGSGNLGGVQALLPSFLNNNDSTTKEDPTNQGFFVQAERDGATPLHWAAAGATAREFGVGGHPEVCQYILSQVSSTTPSSSSPSSTSSSDARRQRRQLVCQLTRDGNSALMWAAWSGTLETVKFLVRNRADPSVANRNGCTVAHWASSGGNVQVCQYLANTVGVDFTEPNHGGNTPLTHAVAFGRTEVVEWLRREIVNKDDDSVAASLAYDFVDWTDGQDEKRQEVLKLFEDWYSHERI